MALAFQWFQCKCEMKHSFKFDLANSYENFWNKSWAMTIIFWAIKIVTTQGSISLWQFDDVISNFQFLHFFNHDKKYFLNFWTRFMQSCKTENNILRKLSLPGCVILHLVPVTSLSLWLCCCSSQKSKLSEEHQAVIAQWLVKGGLLRVRSRVRIPAREII